MKTIYSIILVLFASLSVWAEKYPHILVKDEDKVAVLDKIEKQAWAKHIFNQTKERLAVYVESVLLGAVSASSARRSSFSCFVSETILATGTDSVSAAR